MKKETINVNDHQRIDLTIVDEDKYTTLGVHIISKDSQAMMCLTKKRAQEFFNKLQFIIEEMK